MRTFAVALLAALAFAAPAQAQLAPPPTVLDFEALQPDPQGMVDGSFYPGVTMTSSCPDVGGSDAAAPAPLACASVDDEGRGGGQALAFSGAGLTMAFGAPQVTVSLWVAGGSFSEGGAYIIEALAGETVVDTERFASTGRFGRTVTLTGAEIRAVRFRADPCFYFSCPTLVDR